MLSNCTANGEITNPLTTFDVVAPNPLVGDINVTILVEGLPLEAVKLVASVVAFTALTKLVAVIMELAPIPKSVDKTGLVLAVNTIVIGATLPPNPGTSKA